MFNEKLPTTLSDYLSSHPLFVEKYYPRKDHTTFVFKLSEEDRSGVVEPFLKGEYSKVDRDYVKKYFPDDPGHRLYGNALVLRKHPAKKAYWESKIGSTLPLDAEVWPKPQKKKEVYGYVKDSNATAEDLNADSTEGNHNQISDSDLIAALA